MSLIPGVNRRGRPVLKRVLWEDEFPEFFRQTALAQWSEIMQSTTGVSGKGGNKLRTYRRFKMKPAWAPHLSVISSRIQRTLLSKLRAGVLPLEIETGRWWKKGKGGGEDGEDGRGIDRVCWICGVIEDEEHFIVHCHMYVQIRLSLWDVAEVWIEGFGELEKAKQFEALMASDKAIVIRALAVYVCLAWQCRKEQLVLACLSE